MNKILLSFAFIMLMAFLSSCSREKDPIYIQYTNEITSDYVDYVYEKYGLICDGFGGSYMYNVKEVMLSFQNQANLDLEQARILYVVCVEELLKRFNQSEKIHPYLNHYPFDDKSIRFSISFYGNNQKMVAQEYVAYMFLINGEIYYDYFDHATCKLKDLYKESYSEALEKVREAGFLSLFND